MQILVEPSDYVLRNVGDMAMLHVAVARLGAMNPAATINVFSDQPEQLPTYCPNARPLASTGRRAWNAVGLFDGLPVASQGVERFLRHRAPRLALRILERRGRLNAPLREFVDVVSQADLLVVAGMGGITDAFPEYAHGLLDTVELAQYYRVPTAMVGQGLGPIRDRYLWNRSRKVLSKLDFISLREGVSGLPMLRSFGVPRDRIVVTGDDAIEIAHLASADSLGSGIGVNLRASDYSGIAIDSLDAFRNVLHATARKLEASLVSVPISAVPGEEDADTIRTLINGYDDSIVSGNPQSWTDVFDQLRECRIVVTGSYHAGVFALAQGIPTICIASSQYYVDKFVGLADQFGTGCAVIQASPDKALEADLADVIVHHWNMADEMRPLLLQRAKSQIELGLAAYAKIAGVTRPRKHRPAPRS